MTGLTDALLDDIRKMADVEIRPSPVAGCMALHFHGTAFAHFHDDNELDLWLTKKLIQSLGLMRPAGSAHHPARSKSSAWIEIRFNTASELPAIVKLARLAVEQIKK